MGDNEKRVVICDMGGVVWKLANMEQWWQELYDANNVWGTEQEFMAAKKVALKVAWEPFERGDIRAIEFQILFQRNLDLTSLSVPDFWEKYVHIIGEINLPLIDCLWRMRERGIALALLSNVDEERHNHIRQKHAHEYGIATVAFHDLFFSYQIGSRKPEPKIYRHVFRKVSVLPQYAYYIDDWLPNIEGMIAAIPDMPRENMLLYNADRHDEEAVPFFRRHNLIA